ncbi:MAG: hypothetical protein OXK76_03600 [Gammaproteobacteria bacterium]|nr:hypothetical protein [Gammaproteobacteria bacterium]
MDEKETPSASSVYAVHTSKLCRVFGNLRAVEELDLRVESGTLYRHGLLRLAEALPRQEERILEAITTPVD